MVEVALAALYRRVEGRIELLVARRHADAIRGGLWEFPGGKIEAGESAATAALREIAEEVGLGRDAFLEQGTSDGTSTPAVGAAPVTLTDAPSDAGSTPCLAAHSSGPLRPLLVVEHSDPDVAREKSLRLHAFLAEVKPNARPQALGASEVRWISIDQLPEFEWPKANAPINDRLREILASSERGPSWPSPRLAAIDLRFASMEG
jgi:8-oxo-dGTP pyrophosphatase MutT (NUDIX family)